MDPFIENCSQLFSAAKYEFKHLEYFYFHNFVYESMWKDNRRRWNERVSTMDILHKYASDYKVIFVGDAAMSPYEILSTYFISDITTYSISILAKRANMYQGKK